MATDSRTNPVAQGVRRGPRLPHERDESPAGSRPATRQDRQPQEVMQQAHRDIENGLVDTDRHATPGYEKPESGRKK